MAPDPVKPSLSTGALTDIQLPPKPTEIPENYDVKVLERMFQCANASSEDSISDSPIEEDWGVNSHGDPYVNGHSVTHVQAAADILRRQYTNLERRLQPFWSSVLPGRCVRLHLFAFLHHTPPTSASLEEKHPDDPAYKPVASQDVMTARMRASRLYFRSNGVTCANIPGHYRLCSVANMKNTSCFLLCSSCHPPPLKSHRHHHYLCNPILTPAVTTRQHASSPRSHHRFKFH